MSHSCKEALPEEASPFACRQAQPTHGLSKPVRLPAQGATATGEGPRLLHHPENQTPVPHAQRRLFGQRQIVRSEVFEPKNPFLKQQVQFELENSDDLSRASSNLCDNQDNVVIRPEAILCEEGGSVDDNEMRLRNLRKESEAPGIPKARLNKPSTMSQAESYYPEVVPRLTKLSIFGDPWNQSKERNKNLIAELIRGNT